MTSVLSPEAQTQLDPYLQAGDRVVLLEEKNINEFIQKKNYISPNSPVGHCFGLTQAQLALLTQVKFKPGVRNDTKIANQIFSAATDSSSQVIEGFQSLEEFLKAMYETWASDANPLRLAVEAIQAHQRVKYFSNGIIQISQRDTRPIPATTSFNLQEIARPEDQVDEFVKQIDRGTPVWASSFPIARRGVASMELSSTGHAFVIVGYIQNDRTQTRLIIRDPNEPRSLKIVDAKRNAKGELEWVGEDIKTRSPVSILIGSQELNLEQSQSLQAHFMSTSNDVQVAIHPKGAPEQCPPAKSELKEIFRSL